MSDQGAPQRVNPSPLSRVLLVGAWLAAALCGPPTAGQSSDPALPGLDRPALVHAPTGAAEAQRGPGAAPICANRRYYLTPAAFDGAAADEACVEGFHMASLWELLDPSSLRYDTTLGASTPDSGGGPPPQLWGWIRNGGGGSASQNNCLLWTTAGDRLFGSRMVLAPFSSGAPTWDTGFYPCERQGPTWCVED